MKLYSSKLTTRVEVIISSVLPEKIVLLYDKQTTPETLYVAGFAAYSAECALGYKSVYLALLPLEDKPIQGSDERIRSSESVLKVFGKSLSDVVTLIVVNCSVSRSMRNKIKYHY